MKSALSRRTILGVAAGVAAVARLAAVPSARADAGVAGPTAELVAILASQTDGGTDDPGLKGIPELGKPPLSFYNTRKILERKQHVRLPIGEAVSIAVPDGPTFSVVLTKIVKEEGKAPRFVMSTELKSSASSSKIGITAKAGERAFIGGPAYSGGTLFFGVSVDK